MEVGANIRRLRLQLGLTQKELALACGLTNGMISKVENNVAMPALGTLVRIAEVLQVTVAALMQPDAGNRTVMTINPYSNPDQFVMTDLGYRIFSPAGTRASRLVQPVMLIATSREIKPHRLVHQGEEFIYIIEGEMTFTVGRETFCLRQGDSLYFDATKKHGVASVRDEVKYLAFLVSSHDPAAVKLARGSGEIPPAEPLTRIQNEQDKGDE